MPYIRSRWDKLAGEADYFCNLFEHKKMSCDGCVWNNEQVCAYPFYWENLKSTEEFMECLASQLLTLSPLNK